MKNSKLTFYLDHGGYRRLMKEHANRQHTTLSRCIADCLSEYFSLLDEMASVLERETEAGEAKQGKIIHTLLAETEARIAASVDRQSKRVQALQDDVQILQAMMDRFYLAMMIHLPEVEDDRKEGALASANLRHTKWRRAVEVLLREGGIN
jgi:hypothetical protein